MPSNGLVVVLPIYDMHITEPDLDCDGIIDSVDTDIDGDGILNSSDAFPLNSNESVDTDSDGIGNNADLDDDNDGYSDAEEIAFGSDPLDANDIPVVVSNDGFKISPLVGTSSQVSFSIVLTHKPDSNVTVVYGSADETVAKPTTNSLTFTPDNWYKNQIVRVDILNPNSSTEIVFEPTVSSDSSYNNKMLERVSIVSHQLLLFEPVDKIVYSEFNMSIPINMAYVGDNEENITVVLDAAPNGMVLDADNGRLLWRPALGDEGEDKTVSLSVSDGSLIQTLSFELHVAQPIQLATSVVNGKLVITDNNSSLRGLSIEPLDGAVLADYRIYKLSASDTPALTQGESVVGETFLVKGNIGKKVQITLPLQGLVQTDELLSFHTKSYFGLGNWRRVDYDYDFNGTVSAPVYVLNTEEFAGVVALTKVVPGQQQMKKSFKAAKSKQMKTLNIGVTCSPKNIFDKQALNDQICTFDAKPTVTLQIFNYSTLGSNIDIDDIASWLMEAQVKLDDLGMPYASKFTIVFETQPPGLYGYVHYDDRFLWINQTSNNYGLFKDLRYIPKWSMYLNKNNSSLDMKTTINHEYFHHSQFSTGVQSYRENSWLLEATAVWFEDYMQNNSFDAYPYWYVDNQYPKILHKGLTDNNSDEYYANGLFFEMLEGHCTNFTNSLKFFFFDNSQSDFSGFINFNNVAYQLDCNFGSPTGAGNERRIETKLLYYQYATDIKKDTYLINSEAQQTLNFRNASPVIETNNWTRTEQNVSIYKKWQNSTAQTTHVQRINNPLSHCEERYIHLESQNNLMVSIASNDANFPDTPNTMLGDMKQLNFTIQGKYDFTYFYDQNTGKQIYPELYMTLVDVVEQASDTHSFQPVKMSYGIRRRNLLSHIDNQDVCQPMSPLTQTTVEVKGVIPDQYRDSSNAGRYIDTIKITDVNSGNSYMATVQSNDTWVKTISFTFNNNEAPIHIQGYNSADMNRIIAQEGILIWR